MTLPLIPEEESPFLNACRELDLEAVKSGLLNQDFLARDRRGRGAMHYVLEGSNSPGTFPEKLRIAALLAYFLPKEELNRPDLAGVTPLGLLCEFAVPYAEKGQPIALLQTMNLYDTLEYGALDRASLERRADLMKKADGRRQERNEPYPEFGLPPQIIFYGFLAKAAEKSERGEGKPYFARTQELRNAVSNYLHAAGLEGNAGEPRKAQVPSPSLPLYRLPPPRHAPRGIA